MDSIQEIDKAIGAHGMWKSRLKQAIDTGTIDTPPATIRTNNQCAFGQWLYGPHLTPQDKASQHYKTVVTLHTQFHQLAGHIAETAISGNKAEAEKMIGLNSEYASISSKLTAAMMAWKKSFSPAPTH